jgi:hypothetical protein
MNILLAYQPCFGGTQDCCEENSEENPNEQEPREEHRADSAATRSLPRIEDLEVFMLSIPMWIRIT